MAVRIHHATVKKARRLGLEFRPVDNEVEVLQGDKVIATNLRPDKALETAIERLGLTESTTKAAKPPKAPKAAKPAKKAEAAEEGDEGEVDDEPKTKSIVRKKYKTEYKARGGHCGDELAEALEEYCKTGKGKKRRVDVVAVKEVGELNGVWKSEYGDLNPGQARMSVGNRLRGMLKSGKPVKVGKQTIQPDVPSQE